VRGSSVLLFFLPLLGVITAPPIGPGRAAFSRDAPRVEAAGGGADRGLIDLDDDDRDVDSDDDPSFGAALPVAVVPWRHSRDARSFPVSEPSRLVSCSFVHFPLHVPRA
jgi:hypothetical protein